MERIRRKLSFFYSTIREPAGVWTFARYAHRKWKVYIRNADNNRVAMTGSAVTTELHVDFPHRFGHMIFYHTDASGDASTDSLTITVRRPPNKISHPTRGSEDLYTGSHTSADTTVAVPRVDREAGVYEVLLNTTSGHFVVPTVYLEELEK